MHSVSIKYNKVPEPSFLEVQLVIEKLKSLKSPVIDQIPAELIKAGGGTIRCAIYKLIIAIWNKEELPGEWKESIILPIHNKRDKTDCNNYRGITILPTTYKILSNILPSRLIPYAEEIIGDHQCGFRRNRTTTDHIFCIRQILEENGNTMRQCIISLQTSRKLMIQLGLRPCTRFSLSWYPQETGKGNKNVSD